MTPSQMEVAIHYYHRVDDFNSGDLNAPAVAEAIAALLKSGLLERGPTGGQVRYVSTQGLALYVRALCSVPTPRRVWAMP